MNIILEEVSIMVSRRGRAEKWTTGRVLLLGTSLMLIGLFIFGGPLQFLYNTYGPDWMRVRPDDVDVDADQISQLSVRLASFEDSAVPAAGASTDIYDASMTRIERATHDTTTGVATFRNYYWEGETVYVQVYVQGATTTGITYATPMMQFTVPAGDSNDRASLGQITVYDVTSSTTQPTLVLQDQAGNGISTVDTYYINSTDTSLNLRVTIPTADTTFGLPADYTDPWTGFSYKAGIWVVVTVNGSVPFANYDYKLSGDAGNTLYVWNFPAFSYLTADPSSAMQYYTLTSESTFDFGGAAGANRTFSLDVYDLCRLDPSGNIHSASFYDFDTSNTVAPITTYIHT